MSYRRIVASIGMALVGFGNAFAAAPGPLAVNVQQVGGVAVPSSGTIPVSGSVSVTPTSGATIGVTGSVSVTNTALPVTAPLVSPLPVNVVQGNRWIVSLSMTDSWYYVSQQITIPKAAVIESLALNCQATGTTFAHAFFSTSNAPSPAGGSGYAGANLPLSPNPFPGSGYSAAAFLPPTIINFPILAGTISVGVQGTAQATELRCFGYIQGHYTTT